ncbi:uncharacterized protein LOC141856489 isoform X1 [Brevipalpus obovatus]|uniref:uncharacterized protein LOC141856489 isoform X1 n=1 Tax=Brevipalpus obovatus TaxID=246614 RepID=UPI003D9FA53E
MNPMIKSAEFGPVFKFFDYLFVHRRKIMLAGSCLYLYTELFKPELFCNTVSMSDRWKKFRQSGEKHAQIKYKEPTILPHLQEIIDEALAQTKLMDEYKKQIVFKLSKIHTFHRCGISSHILGSKLIIHLPEYLNMTPEYVRKDVILGCLHDYSVNLEESDKWLTPDGLKFIKTFILTPAEKKFLITHAIYTAVDESNLWRCLNTILYMYTIFITWNFVRLDKTKPPAQGFITFLAIVSVMAIILYLINTSAFLRSEQNGLAKTATNNLYKSSGLKRLVSSEYINEEMVNAGISYYQKMYHMQELLHELGEPGRFEIETKILPDGKIFLGFQQRRLEPTEGIEILSKLASKPHLPRTQS